MMGTFNKSLSLTEIICFEKLHGFSKISLQKNEFVTSFLNWFSNFFHIIKGYFKAIKYNMCFFTEKTEL